MKKFSRNFENLLEIELKFIIYKTRRELINKMNMEDILIMRSIVSYFYKDLNEYEHK